MARNPFDIGLDYDPLTGKKLRGRRKPVKSKTRKELLYKRRKCQWCRRNKVQHLHHVKGVAKGGSNRKSNLIALCAYCHQRVHSGEITSMQLKRRMGIKIKKKKKSKRKRKKSSGTYITNIFGQKVKVPDLRF